MYRTFVRFIRNKALFDIPGKYRKLRPCYGPAVVQRFIEKEAILTTPENSPEITMMLLDITSPYHDVNNMYASSVPGVSSMFWGHYLPDMLCLTRYILDNKNEFKNKSVLDFTGGCGATGIALLMANCKYVILNEMCIACGCAAKMNAIINEIPMERFIVFPEHLMDRPIKEDIVLMGEPRFGLTTNQFVNWIYKIREANKIVYAARINSTYEEVSKQEDIENEKIRKFFIPVAEYQIIGKMAVIYNTDSVTIYQLKL